MRISTEYVYVAVWIAATGLSQQGDLAFAVARIGRDEQYEFQPGRSDEQHRRLQAALWRGTAPAFPPSEAALIGVMQEMGMGSQVTDVMMAPAPVRRAASNRLFELLEGVKQREFQGGFVLGAGDSVGVIRDRLLTNPTYRAADTQRRLNMMADWQRRLLIAR